MSAIRAALPDDAVVVSGMNQMGYCQSEPEPKPEPEPAQQIHHKFSSNPF